MFQKLLYGTIQYLKKKKKNGTLMKKYVMQGVFSYWKSSPHACELVCGKFPNLKIFSNKGVNIF